MPVIWQQSSNLLQEVPQMVGQGHTYLLALPEQYPHLVSAEQIGNVITLVNDKLIEWGQVALKASLNSISNVVALLIYLILVPLMVFFFLKDKSFCLIAYANFCLTIDEWQNKLVVK